MAWNEYSGLAPAVNTHLAKFREAERGVRLARTIAELQPNGALRPKDGVTEQQMINLMADEWLWRWIAFASSYGLPNVQGIPEPALKIIDGTTASGREQDRGNTVTLLQGVHLALREHAMLQNAISHYVSAEVLDLLDEATEEMEPEKLFDTDLFTPNGFAVFERPVIFPDLNPVTGQRHATLEVAVRAVGWRYEGAIHATKAGIETPGVSIFFYTTREDYEAWFHRSTVEAGFIPPIAPEEVANGLVQIEVLPWGFGQEWTTRTDAAYIPGTVPEPIGQQRRWFLAFMRFMWQTIIQRHAVHPDRATKRRWERAGKKDMEFTVLRLRRIEDPFYRSEGTGVGLDKRIKVRGHWRRQYYPSLGHARNADGTMNPESHRLVWVDEHWRGPEDAPLGAMHSATSVVR